MFSFRAAMVDPLPAALARLVHHAERPSPLSARDGLLLRLVPRNEALLGTQLEGALAAAGLGCGGAAGSGSCISGEGQHAGGVASAVSPWYCCCQQEREEAAAALRAQGYRRGTAGQQGAVAGANEAGASMTEAGSANAS